MDVNDIFTEYNSNLINQIDRDPLGFQQIWTHFGQKIFESKTTSVATDIRNYTINLIHHNVIRQLPEKCPVFWHLVSQRSYKEGIEKSIILFEMMLAHSRVLSGDNWTEPKGILGTSMAFKRWQDGKKDVVNLESSLSDPRWNTNTKDKSFEMLLVRQTSLGINGRYKGPFMKMGLFKSDYKYIDYADQWDKIDIAINTNKILSELQKTLFKSLKNIKNIITFSPSSLWYEAYQTAFKTHDITAEFALDFWPKYLGFKTGAAKSIFDIIIKDKPCQNELSIHEIFEMAKNNINSLEVNEIKAIQNILDLEPILVQLDTIFQLLLKTQDTEININNNLLNLINSYPIPDSSPLRLKNLIESIRISSNIPESLCRYHEKVMNERGNMPWIRILEHGDLKVYLQSEIPNSIEDLQRDLNSPENTWIHPYYIPSMKEIVCGMTKSK